MIGKPLRELCSPDDYDKPLYPLTERWTAEQLHHGLFVGIGYRGPGRAWLLDENDIAECKARLRADVDLDARPSGVSSRSRRFRKSA